jgi:uncharacterized phage protein gp47/JayE
MSKTKEEVLQNLITKIQTKTQITEIDPGTIARALCDILAEEFGDFYDALDLTTTMGFVSTAKGQFLDMIGKLVNCTRVVNEIDTNYRIRITNQVFVTAGSNQISIRLKVLSIPGVKDVIMKEFTKGPGSFSVYIITDDVVVSTSLVSMVEDIVNQTKAEGIMADVKTPILIPLELRVRLIFNNNVSDVEKATIRQASRLAIKTYIDNIGLGGTFILNEITRDVLNASQKISDMSIYSMKIANVSQFPTNFSVNWDQRIVIDILDVI